MAERLAERVYKDPKLAAAMYVLLDELRMEHIRVVGVSREAHEKVEDYDTEWVQSVTEGGPVLTVMLAMREHPVLWRDAIPEELVLVPRKALKAVVDLVPLSGLGKPSVEALEHAGIMLMDSIAYQRAAIREQREEEAFEADVQRLARREMR